MKNTQNQKTIEQKEYVVIWHYCANYGKDIVKATSPQEAIENHLFFKRDDIELFAFENKISTSAWKMKGMDKVM